MATKPKVGQITATKPRFEYVDVDRSQLTGARFYDDTPAPSETTAPESPGMLRRMGDTAVQFGQGAVTGVKMMADVFGANNAVSRGLGDVNQALDGLLSATAQGDKQKVAQIMQEAEGKGWGDQIIAGLKAAGVDPVGLAANALGTSLPTMATMLIPGAGPAAVATRMGAGVAMGAGQGVGSVKGQIYDETKRKWLETGAAPEQAEAKAQEAAAYGGANTDQMAIGGVLGMGSVLGAERALGKVLHGAGKAGPGMLGRVATTTAAETGTEMMQGGQEKFATNTALNRQGFDVDPMSGVIANATLEGAAAAPMGAIAGIPRPAVAAAPGVDPAKEAADAIRATETLPESGPMTRASNAATEAKAQAIEAGAPLLDEQAAAEPVPEPVDDPVRDQILALPDGARQDALRAYAVVNRDDVAKGVLQYNRKLLDRLLAENQPKPVLGDRLTDTDMGAMLGGGGMMGNADPLMGALGMNREAQANSITNVAQTAQNRPPMPASDAVRMLDEARNQGVDLVAAEHPAGGFVLVPPQWVTPEVAAQGEQRLNETIARMQQADADPVERAPRNRISPVELNLQTDPVQNFIGTLRTVNTPAARAYVQDFDAGRITPADVQQRMQAEQGLTPEQRLQRAAAEAPATADPVADRLRSAAAQSATVTPTDILNPSGLPFKTKMAADLAAKKSPGAAVLPVVDGGFLVRPKESVSVQDVPQAPEVPQASPAISPPGQAPQAVGTQPAGPAAGVPTEGSGAVEAAGVEATSSAAVTPSLFTDPRTGAPVVVPNKATADAMARSKQLSGKVAVRKATPAEMADDRNAFTGYNAGEARRMGYVLEMLQPQVSQPNKPQTKAQQAQAATENVATTNPQEGAAKKTQEARIEELAQALKNTPEYLPLQGVSVEQAKTDTFGISGSGWYVMRDGQKISPQFPTKAKAEGVMSVMTGDRNPEHEQLMRELTGAANQLAQPPASTQQAQAATESVASNSAGQDEKARWLKSVADMNRMSGQFGAQINGVANGRLSVVGNPNATKQGRALMAAVDEARRAGATNEEIAAAATTAQPLAQPQAALATHADPGQAPEAATPAVVTDSLKKAARNEDTKPSDMRKWLVGKIDEAIAVAPEAAVDFLSFDVPGDGTFKVQNSQARLQEFRKKVMASPGFKDGGQRQNAQPLEQTDSALNGSGSTVEAIRNFLADGDVQGAVEYARLKGVEFTPVAPQLKLSPKGKAKHMPASVKSSVPSVAEGLTQVEAEQINQYLTAESARKEPAATQDADVQPSPQDFIPAPDGGLDYGEITPEMGKAMRRQAGKIRLQHGVQNSNSTGWGLVHIEANHGKQISGLGFGSVQDFVAHVASSIQQVWQVPGNSQLLLTLKDGRKDVMYIQLEIAKEGDFYRVNSAFPVRQEDYESLKGMKKIWDGSEPTSAVTGQRPAFATAASASPESESSQGSSNARGQDASVPPTAPAAQPDTPKLTPTEAKSLMAWEDLGQKDGVKTHALTFYESQADKDAKRGRMIVAKVSKGDRSATAWMVDGEDKTFGMLAQAKKLAEEVGMARAVADGYVEQGAAQDKAAAPAASSAPIEDAGEKIGGARKDRWKERGLNLDDLDAMTEAEGAELATKANVWKPDYEALSEASEPVTAAMVKTIYDQLAAKPKKNTPEGRRQYVQMMRIVRDVLTEAKGPDAVRNAYLEIRKRAGLNTMDPQAKTAARELLFSVYKGRSDPFVMNGADLMKVKKMVDDGFPAKGEPWKTRLTVGRREGGNGTTERGIEMYMELSAEVGTPLTREQIEAGFFRVQDKKNQTVAFAATKEDAEAAAATVYERDMKGKKDSKPEPVRPNLDELKRENLPQRIDRDVTSEDFVRDLGFRGVEFGNWSAQDERQRILNMAYDGLMDLAEIMGVPPKAMSLNGTLGMAFGARGGGRFAAHYEPGKLVINMTKIRGGGSMAHEWAHAMDHYFGELDKPDAYTTQARGASGWYAEDQYNGVPRKRMERVGNEWKNVEKMRLDNLRPEMAAAFDEVMRALFSKQITKAEMVRSHELDLERTEALARNETQADLKAMYQNMAQNKRQALNELRGDPEGTMYAGRGRSDYASQAQALSGKSENGYWTRPTEMFARAFESWVFDRVTAMGARSDYLVHGVEEDRFAGGAYKGNPYPAGEERARINAAFDKLAQTIQTKETDKGVALFATASAPVAPGQGITLQAAQQATDKVLDGLGMRGVVVPKVFRNTAAAGISDPGSVMPTGGTSNGEVYLFTDNIHDEADAFKVVFHELFHLGLSQSVKPQEYIQTMLQFLRDPLVRKYANEWKQSKDGRSRLGTLPLNNWHALAVEEALAVIGENLNTDGKGIGTKEMQGWVRRTIAWLADLAQSWKMPAVARKLRGMTYTQAEAFVQATMLKGRTGAPVLLPDTRFRSAADAAKAVGDTIKSITVANVKQRAGFKFKDYLGLGLQTLGRRQIVDIYGDLLPLAEYNRLVTQMEADKNEGGAEADKLVTRWAKLQDESKLADLMHDATLAQIDPDQAYVDGDDKGKFLMLERKFKLLSDDAKAVYRETRDAYKAHHAKVRSAIKERIERSELKGERKAELLKQMDDEFFAAVKGVYFPLARFGQYVVTVKGPDGKVESVSRAETMAEADALRTSLLDAFPKSQGFSVGRVMLSKEFVASRDAVGRGFMTELYQVLDKQDMDTTARAELEDTLGQLYLSSLPDLSWAKHGIHRKGTPGFSQDARRAYAQNMFHGARYLAKLRYSDLMQDELTAMQKHVDDWREVEDFDQNSAQRVVDEMNKRHESLMNPKSNKLSTWATSLGFVFHLGLSPASAMVNLSQTALVAYPIMGAKWGFGKASAALLKASAEAAKGKNDITGSLNADELAAYNEAVRAGTIDVTMAHDLAGIAQGEDAGVMWKIRPVMRWASFLFHHAERFNRQVTFVAAYRLARDTGADHKASFEQATKATYDGHFDYSACVDDATEILTTTGWKKRADLQVGDVAIATDASGRAVHSKVLAVNVYEGDREVIEFKSSNRFSMVLTPNHDAVIQNYSSRDKKWQGVRKVRADSLKNHHFILRTPLAPLDEQGGIYGEDFASLLGWIAAEGWYSKYRKTTAATDVRIGQSVTHNPEYVAEIRGILERLGGEFKEYTYERSRDVLTTFVLRRSLGRRIQECLPEKMLTPDLVASMSTSEMRAFLMAFLKGDGTQYETGRAWAVGQKNGANLDLLQAMATMCGMRATLSPINGDGMAHLYVVPDDTGARSHVRPLEQIRRVEPLVWCPTTEHGTWIARRNGAVFVTGNSNRPRVMQGNVAKVLLLFKQYGQNMVYTLARNAQQSIKGESPEVRAQARKALGGLLATHAAAAGVLGLPMVTTLLAAASMIGGDDDEPWDAKVALQNMLADTFGQKPAEVLAHGLSRLTPWDISGKVGLDRLIFPDVQEGLEGQRLWESAATQALGPVGGIFGGALKGLDLMSDGHYLLGLEAMLPAVLRQGVKSIRYATEGAQDKTGVVIKDEVSMPAVVGQLLGFSPSEVRLAQEGKSAIYQQDKALAGRRQELLTKAARATMAKDAEARAEAMKEIQRFNQKNPTRRITPLNVLQSVRNSQRRIDQAEGGVYLPKNRRAAMEAGRFAVEEVE